MDKKTKAEEIVMRLKRRYKNPGPFLKWSNPLELVIGTVLSAQCTDKRVNSVTKKLFKKYKTADDYMLADLEDLEKDVFSTGFYKSKARYLKNIGRILVEDHSGLVPCCLDALLKLPGVSYKTAHIIMAKACGVFTGIPVDTHVRRLSFRIGLTDEKNNTAKQARCLEKIFKKKDYLLINEYLITLGRDKCGRIPKCKECVLQDLCKTGKILDE